MKCLLILSLFFCVQQQPNGNPTKSSDNAINAIDPKGTISDISIFMDSSPW